VIRAVLDANVLVSGIAGFAFPDSPPGSLLRRLVDSEFALVSSEPILAEVHCALDKPFFKRSLTKGERVDLINLATKGAEVVTGLTSIRGVASHPEDDLILATAAEGRADYLVTGDRQLLALVSFRDVQIVTAREFWDLLST
jgi:putative PIN family toxin of toxin-antitoxin system